jgi:hypothetical protein
VPHVHRQRADVEAVAVTKETRPVVGGERVLPIASPLVREKQLDPDTKSA